MIKKKFIFIGLFAALFFTACEDETNHYLHPTYLCGLKNNSGHDLKITLVREDTIVHYHFADNDSAVFVVGKGLYISDGYPGSGFGSLYTDQYWIPYDTVERIATLTFDDTYSHVSRVIYYFDSIGALERRICTPGDCNFFSKSRPFFDFHDYIQNDTVLEQYIITPAYYDQAVEQNEAIKEVKLPKRWNKGLAPLRSLTIVSSTSVAGHSTMPSLGQKMNL